MRTLSQQADDRTGKSLWITAFAVAVSVMLFACVEAPQKAQIYQGAEAETPTSSNEGSEGTDATETTPEPDETDPWAVYDPAVINRTTATDEFGRPVFGSVDTDEEFEADDDPRDTPDAHPADMPLSVDSGQKVFSNKDLSRYSHLKEFGYDRAGNADRTGDPADSGSGDGDGQEGDGEGAEEGEGPGEAPTQTQEEWQSSVQEAEAEIAGLEERIQYLEKRIPSLQNPLLPRASVSEEDREAEKGMRQDVRLNKVKNDIDESRREIEKKKKELSQLQAKPPSNDDSDN